MIVHRDGPAVRLYSRNAYDWTAATVSHSDCCPADQSKELHD
jgi:ATP-dependent DNA ligase